MQGRAGELGEAGPLGEPGIPVSSHSPTHPTHLRAQALLTPPSLPTSGRCWCAWGARGSWPQGLSGEWGTSVGGGGPRSHRHVTCLRAGVACGMCQWAEHRKLRRW